MLQPSKSEKTALLAVDPEVYKAENGTGSGDGDGESGPVMLTLDEMFKLVGHGAAQNRVLVVCGLCFMSDSIEVGLLSFLQVRCSS